MSKAADLNADGFFVLSYLSPFYGVADPVINRLHGQALNNSRKEYNGVCSAENDIVGFFRQHFAGAHGKGDRQAASQTSPCQQLDKAESVITVGGFTHKQRGNTQAAKARDEICRDCDQREYDDVLHLQNVDKRQSKHYIKQRIEQHIERFPKTVEVLRLDGVIADTKPGTQIGKQDSADDGSDRAGKAEPFADGVADRNHHQADKNPERFAFCVFEQQE